MPLLPLIMMSRPKMTMTTSFDLTDDTQGRARRLVTETIAYVK
jgi:hypothetical protein